MRSCTGRARRGDVWGRGGGPGGGRGGPAAAAGREAPVSPPGGAGFRRCSRALWPGGKRWRFFLFRFERRGRAGRGPRGRGPGGRRGLGVQAPKVTPAVAGRPPAPRAAPRPEGVQGPPPSEVDLSPPRLPAHVKGGRGGRAPAPGAAGGRSPPTAGPPRLTTPHQRPVGRLRARVRGGAGRGRGWGWGRGAYERSVPGEEDGGHLALAGAAGDELRVLGAVVQHHQAPVGVHGPGLGLLHGPGLAAPTHRPSPPRTNFCAAAIQPAAHAPGGEHRPGPGRGRGTRRAGESFRVSSMRPLQLCSMLIDDHPSQLITPTARGAIRGRRCGR